jgi:repressor LexA
VDESLTRRQRDIVDHLRDRAARGLPAPSMDEVCTALGVASRGSLHKHVVALVEAGVLEPMHGLRRGLRLTAGAAAGAAEVPLLGRIAAGRPIEAVAGADGVEVPAWLRPRGRCYVLEVRGDSMRDDGIHDGDRIVVEATDCVRDGQVVVALVDGENATLKRFYRRRGKVVLQPANADYAPLELPPERVVVQGVVTGVMRRVD